LLTDEQIERYSRQIILPEVGGRGQERLLAANLTLMAEVEDLTPALNYLAGAGIGTIGLDCPASGGAGDRLAAQAMELNPDVRVEVADHQVRDGETLLVLAGTDRVVEAARRVNLTAAKHPMIFARLAEPYLIAVLPGHPPCLACAHDALLAPLLQPGPLAAPIAMAAVTETIKSLLAVAPQPARLIEFSGYESRSHELTAAQRAGCRICG
jgi:adenylyltransferase/sulfurtransferase